MAKGIFNSLFRRNDRKEINKQAAQRAMGLLNTIIRQCSDAGMAEKLVRLQTQMNHGQVDSDDETIKEIYFRIICYLKGLGEDVRKGVPNIAGIRVEHLVTEIGKLGNYAQSAVPFSTKKKERQNKKFDKELESYEKAHAASILSEEDIDIDSLYTNDELLQISIYREQSKLDALKTKLDDLNEQSWNTGGSMAIASDIQRTKDLIRKEEEILRGLVEVRDTNSAADYMMDIPKKQKQAMALTGISVEEFQSLYQNFQAYRANKSAETEVIAGIHGDICGTSQTVGATVGTAQNFGVAVRDDKLQSEKSTSKLSQEDLMGLYSKAKKQEAALKREDERYRGLIEEKQAEQRRAANNLKRLLMKRRSLIENGENVSVQECAGCDSEIEKARSQCSTVERALEQLTRRRNKYNAELHLVERILTTLEIQKTQERIGAELGDQMLDMRWIAKRLQQFDEEENKKVSETRDALAIADGVDVETSVSDYGIDDSQIQNLADPDKYADLEKRFGLR